MAVLLSNQVRIPSVLGLTGLLALAVTVSSAGLSSAPVDVRASTGTTAASPAATEPTALVAASPDGAIVVAEHFPANAVVRIYAGAPVAGATYQSLGETRTDASGTAAVRLDGTALAADGPISVVVATPDFRARATARVN